MGRFAIVVIAAALASGCATRLPPLSPADHPELRMWHTAALSHGVDGVVVTPGVVSFYAGEDVAGAKLVESIETPGADEVLGQLRLLAGHDGKWLSCTRIQDGWSLNVEGASPDGMFAFTAHVPNLCTEGPPREVFDIFERLSALREKRPN